MIVCLHTWATAEGRACIVSETTPPLDYHTKSLCTGYNLCTDVSFKQAQETKLKQTNKQKPNNRLPAPNLYCDL